MPVNSFENYMMSWKPVLKDTKQAKYLELAQMLEDDIKNGVLKPGTKLPPQRELADYLDLNLSTITRAFKICSMRGIISSAVGSGTFVSSDAASSHLLLHEEKNKLIEMGAILPDERGNERVLRCIQNVLNESNCLQSMQYALPEGNERQKLAAKKWLAYSNIHVDEQQILISNGSQNAISAILLGLFHRGDTIGTNSVIYPGFKSAAKMMGIKVIPIAEKGYELTEEGITYAVKNENMKGIYIIPDYSNPTTHTMSINERKMIARVAKANNLLIIEDAINSHLRDKIMPAVASYAPEHTVHIASLSKIFSPGLRLAYVSVPLRMKLDLLNALYCLNISPSMLMVEVATRIIESKEDQLLTKQRRENIIIRNRLLDQILDGHTILGNEDSSFRWMLLPKEYTGRTFEMCAKSLGVQVFSAERFAVGSIPVQNAVRIAIPSASSEEEFERGVYALKSLFQEEDTIGMLY